MLPTDSVFVAVPERHRALINLPSAIASLPVEVRPESLYISKFIAACSMGLFDAALNYLWDETIQRLRKKVTHFDLDYFFDNAVSADQRNKYTEEKDLEKITDDQLIRTCQKTGLISDIAYKHLDYIRDMRNHASAAHPNHQDITGLSLVNWLEICIREVIGKEPELGAVQIKQLLKNIRENSIQDENIPHINGMITQLPYDLAKSLLASVFGLYTSLDSSTQTRSNIQKISEAIWLSAPESSKNELGLKYASFLSNADQDRAKYAKDFLTQVNGMAYLPDGTLAIEIERALDSLMSSHLGFNNFYNEVPNARVLATMIPQNGVLPKQVVSKYVNVLTHCFIGNGHGVSSGAYQTYSSLISLWTDAEMEKFIKLPLDPIFSSTLRKMSCAQNFKNLASSLHGRASGEGLKEALVYIANFNISHLSEIDKDSEYKRRIARFAKIQ